MAEDNNAPLTAEAAAAVTFDPIDSTPYLRRLCEVERKDSPQAFGERFAIAMLSKTKSDLVEFLRKHDDDGLAADGWKAITAARESLEARLHLVEVAEARLISAGAVVEVEALPLSSAATTGN